MSKKAKIEAPQGYAVTRYHVTPFYNLQPILKTGIDPARSTGAKEAAWYVSDELIEWAIAHIMQKYQVAIFEVIVLEVLQAPGLFVTGPTPGTFQTYNLMRPIRMYSAEQWKAREE